MNFELIPNILKPFLEIGISFIYIFLFNKIYVFLMKNIYITMKEEIASDYYTLINLINYILLFFIGGFFLLINCNSNHYIYIILEFLIFFIDIFYSKASLNLMNHFIFILFRDEILKEKEYISFIGSIEYYTKSYNDYSELHYKFLHIFTDLSIDYVRRIDKSDKFLNM